MEEKSRGGQRRDEEMKKTNIPSSMYMPSSELSGDIFSGGNIHRSQAPDQAEYVTVL